MHLLPHLIHRRTKTLNGTSYLACLLLCLLLFGIGSKSISANDLYAVAMPVQDQSEKTRTETIRRALVQVLIKLTGDPNAAVRPELTSVIQQATRYVQQYRYGVIEPESAQSSHQAVQRSLWIRFDQQALDRALQGQSVPVWEGRPNTLIWLAIKEPGRRYLVGSNDASGVDRMLELAAENRGMSLYLPVMDLKDQQALRFSDVWADFEKNIRQASARYNPTAIATAKIAPEKEGHWVARWTLYQHSGAPENWESKGNSRNQAITRGGQDLIEALVHGFAPTNSSGADKLQQIRIDDLLKLVDYVHVSRYLSSLKAVQQVDLVQADGRGITFALQYRGDLAALRKAIATDRRMIPALPKGVDSALADPNSLTSQALRYRLSR